MPGIPTYGADGLRRRNHSLETLLYLESRKAVVLRRTRKGEVVCARFYGESYTPIRTRVKAGTRYSYLEQIGRHPGWAHTRLPRIVSGLQCETVRAIGIQRKFTRSFLSTVISMWAFERQDKKSALRNYFELLVLLLIRS